jgi:hypothetical protein
LAGIARFSLPEPLDGGQELLWHERFRQEVVRGEGIGLGAGRRIVRARGKHHANAGQALAQARDQLQPVHRAAKSDVYQREVGSGQRAKQPRAVALAPLMSRVHAYPVVRHLEDGMLALTGEPDRDLTRRSTRKGVLKAVGQQFARGQC